MRFSKKKNTTSYTMRFLPLIKSGRIWTTIAYILAAGLVLLLVQLQFLSQYIGHINELSKVGVKPRKLISHRNLDFSEGALNIEPTLYRQCFTVRFRGDQNNYTFDDAVSLLQNKYVTTPGPRNLRMGIMLMEDIQSFLPILLRAHGQQYHMYHYVEMIVMAYIKLHALSNTLPIHSGYASSTNDSSIVPTSLANGSPSITVPWIFSPHMSQSEICGGASGINCVISDLVLQGSKHSIFSSRSGIIGLNEISKYTSDTEAESKQRRVELAQTAYGDSPAFADEADGVLIVERFGCDMGGINKPWSAYVDLFPAYSWHSDLLMGLGRTWESYEVSKPRKLVVGYIDRQNATTRQLRPEHHEWILQYGTQHENIDFRHLQMEKYSAVEQINQASQCDMLIGMHGNGLTHALWMQPRRYVIEFFWKFNYQFDYATTAQLMKHSYLAIQNGHVVNPTLVANRDPTLRQSPARLEAQRAATDECMYAFEHEGKVAVQQFVEKAMKELKIL